MVEALGSALAAAGVKKGDKVGGRDRGSPAAPVPAAPLQNRPRQFPRRSASSDPTPPSG